MEMINSTVEQDVNQEQLIKKYEEELFFEDLEKNKWKEIWKQIKKNWIIYLMVLPVVLFFVLFRYLPINGILIAFKNFADYTKSVNQAEWVGFAGFEKLLFGTHSSRFWQAFRNTFTLSAYGLIFGFPAPIVVALLFSEVKNIKVRTITQILSYLPHFLSTVVVTSLIFLMFFGGSEINPHPGLLAGIFKKLGIESDPATNTIMANPKFFRPIYIVSGIWEGAGYGSIVYFAAIMSISPTSYEAAKIDGATKLDQIKHITFPGMAPTLTIMLILRIGQILSVGFEKVILLSGPYYYQLMETAEVLSTFSATLGGIQPDAPGGVNQYGITVGAAGELFNSLIAMFLVLGSNYISRKVSDTSLF
ncbi:MAG: ABC transporter permease [Acholeplasmataceae bacterium]|jgi:putative aldouronate transport system permease protein